MDPTTPADAPPDKPRPRSNITRPLELGFIALAVSWSFDFLFWEKTPGISFAILVILILAGGSALAWRERIRPAVSSLLLFIPISFFAGLSFIRDEPLTQFLNYGLTLSLLGLLANTLIGGRWPAYSLSDYLHGLAEMIASGAIRPVGLFTRWQRAIPAHPHHGSHRWIPYLRGAFLAVPFLALFSALLSAADPIFSRSVEAFLSWFRVEDLPELLFRGSYTLILGYGLTGLYLHALTLSQDDNLIGVDKPWLKPFLGISEAVVVVGAVDLLFTAFVVIQFRYFFGGQITLEANDFTYAEYARRGFAELVIVSVISFFLLWGLSNLTNRERQRSRRVFSALGILLVLLLLVILGSAFQRLLLYEGAFGFTRLRTYTHVFMAWLGVLLVLVIGLEVWSRQRAFALAALGVSLGFGLSLNLLNVDAFIVEKNINRAYAGAELDVDYLQTLSLDAAPALARAYDRSAKTDAPGSEKLTGEITRAFACHASEHTNYAEDLPWPSFHFARRRARAAWLDRAGTLPSALELNCPFSQ